MHSDSSNSSDTFVSYYFSLFLQMFTFKLPAYILVSVQFLCFFLSQNTPILTCSSFYLLSLHTLHVPTPVCPVKLQFFHSHLNSVPVSASYYLNYFSFQTPTTAGSLIPLPQPPVDVF